MPRRADSSDATTQRLHDTVEDGAVALDAASFDAASTTARIRQIVDDAVRPERPPLLLGDILGQGGMGVVRAAVQSRLQRTVAVKTLRDTASAADAAWMLREAWITGYLEHPNIVPIHDIVVDAEGAPLVVMRRIQGATWESRMSDELWVSHSGNRDLLEQNLRIFAQVCLAVEFAHDKGILHRDLKPANVMIGAFGEVYVVDWGLGLALRPDLGRDLPLAGRATALAGTPAYMAPEMAMVSEEPLSRQTDVYLLGAVLFEVVTGSPPHHAPTMVATVASIAATPPALPGFVAPALAKIIARAMSFEPRGRHPSAAALRLEVLEFLAHRESLRLSDRGRAIVRELEGGTGAPGHRKRLLEQWQAARFSFQEALRSWPDNAEAREGLRALDIALIEHELGRDVRVAASLLEAMVDPPRALAMRVAAAAGAEAERHRLNAQLAASLDPERGRRERIMLLVFAGFTGVLSSFIGPRIGELTHRRLAVGALVSLPIIALVYFLRPDLRRTVFNRRLVGVYALLIVIRALWFMGSAETGISVTTARIFDLAISFVVSAVVMVTVDLRFAPQTVALLGAVVVAVLQPSWIPYASSLGYAVATMNLGLIWWRQPEERVAASESPSLAHGD